MKDKNIKDSYTYYFVDGTKSTVTAKDVGQDLINLLYEMDDEERNHNRRERRRHISIDMLTEKCLEPSCEDEHNFGALLGEMENEQLQDALKLLTPAQQNLLYSHLVERNTVTEIAADQGVAVCSISNRLARIYKKLKNFV